MALSNFISKLNWRLMVVHFVACWFIYHALNQLGYLYDYNFLEFAGHHTYEEIVKAYMDNNQPFGVRISMDLFYAGLAGLAGILISFVISFVLAVKHKWLWLNSLVVLLAGFGSIFINKFYWYHAKRVFMFPGLFFKSDWWFNIVGSMFMLAIGLCLFFSKRIIRFIDANNARETLQTSPVL